MSKNVQIKVENDEDGTPIPKVFYGTDEQEQKEKGAYYTDKRFVDYMIEKAVKPEFMRRKDKINQAIKTGSQEQMKEALDYLLDMKVADFTAGGGSFLRGAFVFLADQFKTIYELDLPKNLAEQYPFYSQDDGQYQWEKYILEHMIYGVDIDYKAVIISSLTLTLSSLEHHPKDSKLPQLIGRTLIHQNALINSVPYYRRKEVFSKYKKDIAKLIKLKREDFVAFNKLRKKLQDKVISNVGEISKEASFLHIESIELNLPEVYFNEDGSLNEKGGMDVVVGNPPWEKWIPSDDDFFNPYAPDVFTDRKKVKKQVKEQAKRKVLKNSRINEKYEQYKERYVLGSKYFKDDNNYHYQDWKVNNKSTAGHRNLYILAIERFTQLAKPDLDAAILVPDNLVTDAGTTGIRHLLFDNYRVNEFLSFDNNKKIFKAVDSRYKFAVLAFDGEERSTSELKTFFYKRDLEDLNKESEKIPYSIDVIKKYSPEEYALFEPKDIDEYHAYIKIRDSFKSLEKTKLFSLGTDFNKTSHSKFFMPYKENQKKIIPLYEGKFMHQFVIKPDEITEGIDREVVVNKIGNDLNEYRLAIRTVAAATNMRTLISTLLPPNVTATHSLHVQRLAKNSSIKEKLFFLGYLNSYVIDFELRSLVSTNITKNYLNKLTIPLPGEVKYADDVTLLVKELLKENTGYYQDLDELVPGDKYQGLDHDKLVAKLNALIMLEFGLNRQEILKIMDSFKSAKHAKEVEDMTQLIIDEIQEVGEQDGQ
ncbi:Eco57I restriction-modification methylase domain-containing protein [Ligilactobacillus salivarius]|uniref:Eco57I restriction-modification methylase domain-containing protein n=1 Tax=Ligilactobacillus salivarius TaxID=1624 RepID=UPI003993B669